VGSLAILDVRGFPLMLNWYVVHREKKRLPPVAIAFKSFLMREGAALIEDITGVPIPGLYAAGEILGGLYYHNYGSGPGLVAGVVFGRIAGRGAAQFAAGRA